MDFTIPAYKKDEFVRALLSFANTNHFNPGMMAFDSEGGNITVHIQDNVINKLTAEQLDELKAIG